MKKLLPLLTTVLLLFFQDMLAQQNALDFDGIDDNVSTSALVVPTSGDFTVELWGYVTSYSGYQEFVSQGSASDAFYIGTTDATGNIRAGDNWINTGWQMPQNEWVHLAVVKSGTTGYFYANGKLIATQPTYSISSGGTGFQLATQY